MSNSSNTFALIPELIKTQSDTMLGNIDAETEIGTSHTYRAKPDILDKVLNDKAIKHDIQALEDYLKYYNNNSRANFNEITMALRLGVRIGAYYEIEDHRINEYVYTD